MRKLFIFIVLIFGLCGAISSLWADQIAWQIIGHDLNPSELRADVARNANRGFVPVGISFYDQKLFILYLFGEGLRIRGWNLEWYRNDDELEEGLNRNIEAGYNPSGIADAKGLFFVMYIKTSSMTESWNFVQTTKQLDKYTVLMQPDLAKGVTPVGVTDMLGEYWTLVIKNKTGDSARLVQLEEFSSDNAAINKGVVEKIKQGMLPWGLMYYGDSVIILFVKF